MGTKRRKTRLDLHLHTPTSDGHGTPAGYVKAVQKAGLDGIVITDHHVTKSSERRASQDIAKAVRDAGFIVLHGCEYSSDNGHVLIYGVDVDDLDLGFYMPMQEVVWRAREAGGVAVPSHPFHGYKKRLGDDVYQMRDLAALEGYNGQLQVSSSGRAEDASARAAAERMGLGVIANSDAHQCQRIGTCYTEFDGLVRRNQDLVEALFDPSRYRTVVNRRMVAAQERARNAGYSLRGPVGTVDPGAWTGRGLSPYSGQRSFPYGFDDQEPRRESWEDEAYWDSVLGEGGEHPEEDDGLADGDIPEHAFRDYDPEDPFAVSEDPETIARELERLDRAKAQPR